MTLRIGHVMFMQPKEGKQRCNREATFGAETNLYVHATTKSEAEESGQNGRGQWTIMMH